MSPQEFEQLLATALPIRGRLAITLTELPEETELFDLLDRAIIAGESCGAPLAEVHAPRERYGLDGAWRYAAVRESADVLRLVFDADDEALDNGSATPAPPPGAPSVQPELRAG